MIYAAIVDDDGVVAEELASYLERYARESGTEFEADRFSNPVNFLTAYSSRYDVVFLDIDMPDMNGMDVARRMREMDENVALVFVTNMRQYAINGYEVGADDFIVKPVAYYDFAMKLDRVMKRLNKREAPKVQISCDGMMRYVPVNAIRYVEVFHHRLVYHTYDGDLEARGSLNKIEPFLTENNFARCNNFCLVNLGCVKGVDGFTLHISGKGGKGEEEISVSHPRKKAFVAALNKYLGFVI